MDLVENFVQGCHKEAPPFWRVLLVGPVVPRAVGARHGVGVDLLLGQVFSLVLLLLNLSLDQSNSRGGDAVYFGFRASPSLEWITLFLTTNRAQVWWQLMLEKANIFLSITVLADHGSTEFSMSTQCNGKLVASAQPNVTSREEQLNRLRKLGRKRNQIPTNQKLEKRQFCRIIFHDFV